MSVNFNGHVEGDITHLKFPPNFWELDFDEVATLLPMGSIDADDLRARGQLREAIDVIHNSTGTTQPIVHMGMLALLKGLINTDFLGPSCMYFDANAQHGLVVKSAESLDFHGDQQLRKAFKVSLLHALDGMFESTVLQNGSIYNNDSLSPFRNILGKLNALREQENVKDEQIADILGFKLDYEKSYIQEVKNILSIPKEEHTAKVERNMRKIHQTPMDIVLGSSGGGKSSLVDYLHINSHQKTSILTLDNPGHALTTISDPHILNAERIIVEMPAVCQKNDMSAGLIKAIFVNNSKEYPERTVFTFSIITETLKNHKPAKRLFYPIKITPSEDSGTEDDFVELRKFFEINFSRDGSATELKKWSDDGFGKMDGEPWMSNFADYFGRMMHQLPPEYVEALYHSVRFDVPFLPVPLPFNVEAERTLAVVEKEYLNEILNFNDDNPDPRKHEKDGHIDRILDMMKRLEFGYEKFGKMAEFALALKRSHPNEKTNIIANGLIRTAFCLMVAENSKRGGVQIPNQNINGNGSGI